MTPEECATTQAETSPAPIVARDMRERDILGRPHRHAPLAVRFEQYHCPEPNTGCWLWTRAPSSGGYGQIGTAGKNVYAHRYAYERFIGPIPDGLELDHLCRQRLCVNPSHLEPVTRRVNILRGEAPPANCARSVHCVHGHAFDNENTYVPPRGGRQCRACAKYRRQMFSEMAR